MKHTEMKTIEEFDAKFGKNSIELFFCEEEERKKVKKMFYVPSEIWGFMCYFLMEDGHYIAHSECFDVHTKDFDELETFLKEYGNY